MLAVVIFSTKELTIYKWLLHVFAGLSAVLFVLLSIHPTIASGPVDKQTIVALIKSLDSDLPEREEITAALKEIGEPAIPLLIKTISDVNEKGYIRVRAIRVLTDIDRSSPEIVHELIKVLEDDDHNVSRSVAIALGVYCSDEAIDALIQAMGHEKEYMRRSGVRGLPVARYHAVPALTETLNNGNEWQRVGAVAALVDIKSELNLLLDKGHKDANEAERDEVIKILGEAPPVMMGLLNHDDLDIRAGAIRGLRLIGSPARESVPMLVEALDDKSVDIRIEAVKALEFIGERSEDAVPRLIELLNSHDEHAHAARTLGVVGKGSKEVVHELIGALEYALSHDIIPYGAVWALGEAGDAEATPALIDLIERNDLHEGVSEALMKIGKPAVSALAEAFKIDDRQETRKRVAEILANMGESAADAIPALVEVIGDTDENGDIRGAGANALGRIGKQALPEIIGLLGNENADVHGAAIHALGKVGKPALPILTELLEDESELTRAGAVAALGDLGRPNKDIVPDPIIPALIKALDDEDNNVRSNAAMALVNLRRYTKEEIPAFNEAIPALTRVYRDEDESLKESAARALARIGGAPVELLPDLTKDIEGEDEDARRRATWVLGSMGEEGAKALIEMLRRPVQNREEEWVYTRSFRNALMAKRHREFAVSSLIAAMDDEDGRLRVRSIYYLWLTYEGSNRLGEHTFAGKAVPILIQGLKHADIDIRRTATFILGEMVAGRYNSSCVRKGGALDINASLLEDIISAFIEALDDRDKHMRAEVINALYHISSPARDAIPAIIEITEREENTGAIRALGSIGKSDREILSRLINMLNDESKGNEFRMSIVESLSEMLWADNSLSEDILPVLIGLLDDPDVKVRARAVDRLRGKEYAEQIVPALINALEDEESIVRSEAAQRLCGIGENARQAVPALIKAMDDENENVRKWVFNAFQRIKAPEAVPALIGKLSDDDPKMRGRVIRALKHADTPESRKAVDNYYDSMRKEK